MNMIKIPRDLDDEGTSSKATFTHRKSVSDRTEEKKTPSDNNENFFPRVYCREEEIIDQEPKVVALESKKIDSTDAITAIHTCSSFDAAASSKMIGDDVTSTELGKGLANNCCFGSDHISTSSLFAKSNNKVDDLDIEDIFRLREKMPSSGEGTRIRNESRACGQLLENYCKLLKELELQRRENIKLNKDRNKMEKQLELLKDEVTNYKIAAKSESEFREKMQQDLRRLADAIEKRQMHPFIPQSYEASKNDQTIECNIEDIEHYKNQFRVYQEDFKQEKEEKEKLRVLNLKLTGELEEAKQEIESRQRTLLTYAHIFANGNQGQMVIPPAYIGRRVHSSPSTPSYVHGASSGRHTYPGSSFNELHREKYCCYEQASDVIPKGSGELKRPTFLFDAMGSESTEKEQESTYEELENGDNVKRIRNRSKSIAF